MANTFTQPEEIDRVLMEMTNHDMQMGVATENPLKHKSETPGTQDSGEIYSRFPV